MISIFLSYCYKYNSYIIISSYLYGLYRIYGLFKELLREYDEDSEDETEPEQKIDPIDQYLEKNKQTFDLLFFNLQNINQWNINIDPSLYNPKIYESLFTEETNILENQWKTRILFESTPRGNVIMYYDLYRQAFAYMSDQQIPHSVLNGCAMKYVRIFRCLDFFIDTNVLPEGILSPFITIIEEKEKEEKQKQEEKQKKIGINFKNAPFAKLKTYRNSNLQKEESTEPNKNTPLQYKNTFRYLGKTVNFSPLQIPVITKSIPQLEITENDVVSQKSLAYQSFKQLMRAASIYSKKDKPIE